MIFKKIIKRLLSFFNILIFTKLNQKMIIIPLRGNIGTNLISIRKHETFMNPLIKKLYNDNGIFLDIGMNIGQTLLKFKTLFPDSEYLGIEPNPNCISYVNHLIEVNKLKKCQILVAGLSDRISIQQLLFRNKSPISNDSEATFIKDYRKSTKQQNGMYMTSVNLNIFEELKKVKIELIKIDIEGSELFALKGMEEKLNIDRPKIIIEVLPSNSGNIKMRQKLNDEINKFILNLNYTVFGINEGHFSFNLEKLKCIPSYKKDLVNYNYLLLPVEKNNIL